MIFANFFQRLSWATLAIVSYHSGTSKIDLIYKKWANCSCGRLNKTTSIDSAFFFYHNWASTRENLSSGVCEQQRGRPACASAQSDQRFCYRVFESIIYKLASRKIQVSRPSLIFYPLP